MMEIGIPAEAESGETRVALVPAEARLLVDQGHTVAVQRGAGVAAGHADRAFEAAGARLVERPDAFGQPLVLQVRSAGEDTFGQFAPGALSVGMADPLGIPSRVSELAQAGVTAFALEFIPRIARAQGMDVLSSQSSIAGHRAVLIAAEHAAEVLPMMITAAGTLPQGRVLVLGAGVAGLQAIATARRLGAKVRAYDVRPAVAEQVRSVGGEFLDLGLDTSAAEGVSGYAQALGERFYIQQRAVLAEAVAGSDVVIATAQVQGTRAPILITEEMVLSMQPGSVIVDAAAAQGGNCAVSRPNEILQISGVTVLAPTNLPAGAPGAASRLYARNIANFVRHLVRNGTPQLDGDDQIVAATLLTRDGTVVHPRLREVLGLVPAPA